MEPQMTTPIEMRMYGNNNPPSFLLVRGADGGAIPTTGVVDEAVAEVGAEGGALVPTRGRGLAVSL